MRLLPLRRSLFWSSLVVVLLASSPATADPVDYIIFDSDTLLDLGLFTVDPALAGPSGPSNVTMSAFSITETLGAFGPLTVTLADLAGLSSAPHARFVDGQIKAISANSQFELAGGIAVNVDMVPENDPLDLNFVAVAQLFAFMPPDFGTTEFGPIRGVGIRTATTSVPEPSTLLLSSIAAGAVVISGRRRHRVSERARRQSASQQRFVHSQPGSRVVSRVHRDWRGNSLRQWVQNDVERELLKFYDASSDGTPAPPPTLWCKRRVSGSSDCEARLLP